MFENESLVLKMKEILRGAPLDVVPLGTCPIAHMVNPPVIDAIWPVNHTFTALRPEAAIQFNHIARPYQQIH